MSDVLNAPLGSTGDEPLLDTFLREAVPEIKLALGDLIDRENQRVIPDRYARLLPDTTLVVTLRPDAAEAVQPIAAELEGELSDSCMRHGSLYDRDYRVKLRVAPTPGASLFRVSVRRPGEPEPEPFRVPPRPQPAPPPPVSESAGPTPSPAFGETVMAPPPRAPEPVADSGATIAAVAAPSPEPAVDPDATRIDGMAPAAVPGRWDVGRFVVVVEDEEGNEKERFPVPNAMTTVGRQTGNPELRSDVAITDAPHVSRRQLALVWAPRGDDAGFTVYNVGLNPLHVGDTEVPGANRGKGPLQLEELMAGHTDWVPPGAPMRIGEHGPVLRIVDTRPPEPKAAAEAGDAGEAEAGAAPEVEVDPDATRFG